MPIDLHLSAVPFVRKYGRQMAKLCSEQHICSEQNIYVVHSVYCLGINGLDASLLEAPLTIFKFGFSFAFAIWLAKWSKYAPVYSSIF